MKMKTIYGVAEEHNGVYTFPDWLSYGYKVFDKDLVAEGFKFVGEDEGGFEYEKDGEYKKIVKMFLTGDEHEGQR